MSFKQCSAFKPDGERCRRVAHDGSDYCHSHRNYKPRQQRKPPTVKQRLQYHLFDCSDCGRLIHPEDRSIYCNTPGNAQPLCEPCLRLRTQIEARIFEIVNTAPGHVLGPAKIFADLESFGVDSDLARAAILRMLESGQLVRV